MVRTPDCIVVLNVDFQRNFITKFNELSGISHFLFVTISMTKFILVDKKKKDVSFFFIPHIISHLIDSSLPDFFYGNNLSNKTSLHLKTKAISLSYRYSCDLFHRRDTRLLFWQDGKQYLILQILVRGIEPRSLQPALFLF